MSKSDPRIQGFGMLSSLMALVLATPSTAQIGGLLRPLPGTLSPVIRGLGRPDLDLLDPQTLVTQRLDRLDALVRAHPREIERDDRGAPVVRGEVLAVAPSPTALDAARRAGFEVKGPATSGDLVALVILVSPPGVSAREAVRRLRRLDPSGVYDFNHIYQPSGGASPSLQAAGRASGAPPAHAARIGLIDTGVDIAGSVLVHARIEQQNFAGSATIGGAHGTAVASLLVGDAGPFRGAAPDADLFVADVYGTGPTGGAADALVRGLSWLAGRKVRVINVSLVGPPNLALGAAIKALQSQGVVLVAAVGNDGPAAPPAYPASYPGVVAVTAVDAHDRVLLEAGHADHLDFAAPGADMAAAAKGGGYVAVRGTSFASPLVAGKLAVLLADKDIAPSTALDALAAQARHGRPYGRGLVGVDLRTPPTRVGAVSEISR